MTEKLKLFIFGFLVLLENLLLMEKMVQSDVTRMNIKF